MAIAKTTHQRNAQIVARCCSIEIILSAIEDYLIEKVRKQAENTNDNQIKRDNVVQEAWGDQYEDARYKCNQRGDGDLCNHACNVL